MCHAKFVGGGGGGGLRDSFKISPKTFFLRMCMSIGYLEPLVNGELGKSRCQCKGRFHCTCLVETTKNEELSIIILTVSKSSINLEA